MYEYYISSMNFPFIHSSAIISNFLSVTEKLQLYSLHTAYKISHRHRTLCIWESTSIQHSQYSKLGYGLDNWGFVFRFAAGVGVRPFCRAPPPRFQHNQTYSMETGELASSEDDDSSHPVPKLRIRGAILPHLQYAFMECRGATLPATLCFLYRALW